MAFKMKKPSMTQGTKAHSSAVKIKAEQNAAMKMKKEAAMKMAVNQQPMQAPAQPAAAPQQPVQQPMQQPAPTMMKKESPTKLKSADEKTRRARVEKYAKGKKHVGTKRTPEQLRGLAAKAEKAGSKDAAKKMRAKAGRAETEKGRAADYLKKKSPAAMKKASMAKLGKTKTKKTKSAAEKARAVIAAGKRFNKEETVKQVKASMARKKAPLKKPLVGKQKNLPEEIKKKILAAPTKMKKKK